MTKYTEMEMTILTILANNHIKYSTDGEWYDEDGYAHPDTFELTTDGSGDCGTIFSKNNLDPKIYRGVIASLMQKGALIDDEYEVPQKMIAITITKEAFDQIKSTISNETDDLEIPTFLRRGHPNCLVGA